MSSRVILLGSAGTFLVAAALGALLVVAPSSTPPPEVIPAPAQPAPGVTLRQVDGGQAFYAQFTNALPSDPGYFPTAVWLESVVDSMNVSADVSVGLNTYVELTPDSSLDLVKSAGLHAIPAFAHPQASGFVLSDEVDMWAGPGSAQWSGKYPGEGSICVPDGSECGLTVQRQRLQAVPPHVMRYANYGKGVTFWESNEEATRFFSNGFQDVVSADNYWFTDPAICAKTEGGAVIGYTRDLTNSECRLAANYGWTVERIRKLAGGTTPVWAFVEVGHPFEDSPAAATITGPQIRAAVWSSLIHGARGIVYFNHSFGGDCVTQHVLRDCPGDVRPAVTAVNQQIKQLAPMLNAPFLDGAVTTSGPVDVAAKLYGGKVHLLTGANTENGGQATFQVKCGGSTAVVIDENRTIAITNGSFTDTYADGNAVHLYRIEGGTSCGY